MFVLRYRDPLRYGKWLDRRDHTRHPEGGAIELVAAWRAVREDAGLSANETPNRVSQRLDEIAAWLALKERDDPEGSEPGEARNDDPVT